MGYISPYQLLKTNFCGCLDIFDSAGHVYKIERTEVVVKVPHKKIIYRLVWLCITKQITQKVISLDNSFERTAQALGRLLFSDLFELI